MQTSKSDKWSITTISISEFNKILAKELPIVLDKKTVEIEGNPSFLIKKRA